MLRLFSVLICVMTVCAGYAAYAQSKDIVPTPNILKITIEGEIEMGVSAYVKRAVELAESQQSDALLVQINTPGGRLDAALAIKDTLLDAQVPTIAFVKRQAFSAGALIALACEKIYMVPGGVIGAATPVMGSEKAAEKIVSGTRKAFAATAQAYDRDPDIAMAMVDESIAIDGVSKEGKLLSLTSNEAMKLSFINGMPEDQQELLKSAGYEGALIQEESISAIEQVVRFVTSAQVASILLSLAMLAMLLELKAPGWGLAGLVAIIAFGLVFWGHHLAGLAGLEDSLLIAFGIGLLMLEVFVIPGTGIAGLLGGVCLLGGLFLMMVGNPADAPRELLFDAAARVVIAALGALVGAVILYRLLFGTKLFQSGLMHEKGLRKSSAFKKEFKIHTSAHELLNLQPGMVGTAQSSIRPYGTALFEGHSIEVTSRGDFIESGKALRIVDIQGRKIIVETLPNQSEEA